MHCRKMKKKIWFYSVKMMFAYALPMKKKKKFKNIPFQTSNIFLLLLGLRPTFFLNTNNSGCSYYNIFFSPWQKTYWFYKFSKFFKDIHMYMYMCIWVFTQIANVLLLIQLFLIIQLCTSPNKILQLAFSHMLTC